MKVKGRDEGQQEAARLALQNLQQLGTGGKKVTSDSPSLGSILGDQANDSETVNLSLGKAIQQTLDPAKMAAERRAKIEALKQQIAAGQYNPPSHDVAQSVGEELTFEILSNAGNSQE